VGRPGLYATTRQFLDDLGLASLDQLPLLASVEGQAAVLASLNSPEDDANQATLSLEEVLSAPEVPADVTIVLEESPSEVPQAQASESPTHD
jgi:segregation and condensation protein B